ncbi:restriction endonuclease [Saliphagus sp. GCM10025308]
MVYIKDVLQEMDDYAFEHFVADLWTRMGYETSVTSASQDAGVDVLAKDPASGGILVIQAKRYSQSTTVGGLISNSTLLSSIKFQMHSELLW